MGIKKKNSEALEELVKSNFVSSLKEIYLHHLTPSNIRGTVEGTIIMDVHKDGSVKYVEKGKTFNRVLELENPNNTSNQENGISPATIRMYRLLLSACNRAEGLLAPHGLASKGYKVAITISKDVWKNYSLSFRLRYEDENLGRGGINVN